MILFKIFSSRAEAELAKSVLESEGLWAFVAADDQGGLSPGLSFSNGVKLMVQPEELEKAQKLFQTLEDAAVPPDA